jgi:SAM-dependent methyltransferase
MPLGQGRHKGYNIFIEEERNLIERSISSIGNKSLFIDLSGGSGFYSFHFAKYFTQVIHCDISIEALGHAHAEAKAQKIENIYFARCDFRAIPFQQSIADIVILIDSMEYYAVAEDNKIMNSAIDVVVPGGAFIFDIHLKRWFRKNRSIYEYSLKDRKELLAVNEQLISIAFNGLGRLPMRLCTNRTLWKISNSFFFSFLPSARNIYFLTKNVLFPQDRE